MATIVAAIINSIAIIIVAIIQLRNPAQENSARKKTSKPSQTQEANEAALAIAKANNQRSERWVRNFDVFMFIWGLFFLAWFMYSDSPLTTSLVATFFLWSVLVILAAIRMDRRIGLW